MSVEMPVRVTWRDRLGAAVIRHPGRAALGLAAVFYMLLVTPMVLLYGAAVAVGLVPPALAFGGVYVAWLRRCPVGRARADAQQIARLRAAIAASRTGSAVGLPAGLRELATRQARYELRLIRRLRWISVVLGGVLLVAAVVIFVDGAWVLAVLLGGTGVLGCAVTLWGICYGIRLTTRFLDALGAELSESSARTDGVPGVDGTGELR